MGRRGKVRIGARGFRGGRRSRRYGSAGRFETLRRRFDPEVTKAWSSIADANVTTLIAGIVLLGFGSGPIKNFAVTLSLGIATSMFTAVWGTRTLVDLWYGKRRIERLSVG